MNTVAVSTVPAVLDAVLALLAAPNCWTRDTAARDATGRLVPPTSSAAVAWGLDGAIERVVGYWEDETITEDEAEHRRVLEATTFAALRVDPAVMNDAAGYENVLALVRATRSRIAV